MDARFCPHCAAPADATSAETVVLGGLGSGTASAPRLNSTSSVDEGASCQAPWLAPENCVAGLLGRGGMDLQLPVVGGIEASREIRSREAGATELDATIEQATSPQVGEASSSLPA